LLVTREEFSGKIVLAIAVDKGGSHGTKFGFLIGNTPNPSSPSNFTILALYRGDDNRVELESRLGHVLDQIKEINQITYILNGKEIASEIQWFSIYIFFAHF